MTKELNAVLVMQFRGTKCQCGRPKRSRHAFCITCWERLPEVDRKKLPHVFGTEFEKLYFKCVGLLNVGAPGTGGKP